MLYYASTEFLSHISSLEEVAGSNVFAVGLQHFLQRLEEIHLSIDLTR